MTLLVFLKICAALQVDPASLFAGNEAAPANQPCSGPIAVPASPVGGRHQIKKPLKDVKR